LEEEEEEEEEEEGTGRVRKGSKSGSCGWILCVLEPIKLRR
jgi:hypothetical protein